MPYEQGSLVYDRMARYCWGT